MTTSASKRSGRGFGGLLSIIILVTMALLVAAPSTFDAKTQLWLYPDTDDPRAGGHVVTDSVAVANTAADFLATGLFDGLPTAQ